MLPFTFLSLTCFAYHVTAIPFYKPAAKASPYDGSPFKGASTAPGVQSDVFGGANNGTLKNGRLVQGKSFDRIITIWLEGADYDQTANQEQFQNFQKDALLMNSYFGVTHPSEPNYMASIYGTFWGLFNDDYSWIPENMTSIFDLMNERHVSWACYEENMPYTGYQGYNYSQPNYLSGDNNDDDDDDNNNNNNNRKRDDNDGDNNDDDDDVDDNNGNNSKSTSSSDSNYVYYARKHNPCAFPEESGKDPKFAIRNRNFNDFAADLQADDLPQWIFITPNLVNNGHDTNVEFAGQWLEFWLKPLMDDPKFNNEQTLIILTYDANISEDEPNQVYTLAMGNALPEDLRGQTDDTFYTHYSSIATIEANWGLKNLGRGDVQKGLNNVYKWVAEKVNFNNDDVPEDQRPSLNGYGEYPGPLNPDKTTLFFAPNSTKVIGPGGRDVLVKKGLHKNQIAANGPPSVNLTAVNDTSIFHSYEQEFGANGPVFVGGNFGSNSNNALASFTRTAFVPLVTGIATLATLTIL